MIYTTNEAITEEKSLRDTARKGKNAFQPINPDYQVKNEQLTKEQSAAVKHVLSSRDFITVVTGMPARVKPGLSKKWRKASGRRK
ncbi:MAG: hypothetical protein H6573_32820 [Lewinellaceae bacterium]|nr:hypothetical protein [Lewinellaceae bacterium]